MHINGNGEWGEVGGSASQLEPFYVKSHRTENLAKKTAGKLLWTFGPISQI